MSCYCGNTQPYSQCCEPVHHDAQCAQTPEQLMRARFSAHVLHNVDFVVKTYHPSCQASNELEAIRESVLSQWVRLEVVSTAEGSNENEGFVHFKAFLEQNGGEYCLEERSRFIKEDGYWYYIDGEFPSAPAKQGRNDPCACGSGKKFKKCCG
ncbi:YchJ family protein [Vibrio mimicus]|uniref:YchJ family protein n=1 Tax=Vibrio mimicus TaxID=674 RepID=UPI002F933A61